MPLEPLDGSLYDHTGDREPPFFVIHRLPSAVTCLWDEATGRTTSNLFLLCLQVRPNFSVMPTISREIKRRPVLLHSERVLACAGLIVLKVP